MSAVSTEVPQAPEEPVPDMVHDILDDNDFLEHTKAIKQLIDVDYIDDLKPQQAEKLRVELAMVLKYVMKKIEEDRDTEQTEREPAQSTAMMTPGSSGPEEPPPTQQPPMSSGGRITKNRKTKRTRTYKGGSGIDTGRVFNTGSIPNTDHDPYKTMSSAEIIAAKTIRPANSTGAISGYTSVDGLSTDDMNKLLPYYGTGGKQKKPRDKMK